jgi:predicted metal-binding protein
MSKKLQKIRLDMNEHRLSENLENYRRKALELGATHAALVRAADIPVDERVTLKCQIPRCFGYGTGAHCPPHTLKPREFRKQLKLYRWAVFFLKEMPPEVIVRDQATVKERTAAFRDVFQMVSALESLAFYDGHYFAFGLAAGSCRHVLCQEHDSCQALEGKRCRFALLARPSMEAVGIDVYKMTALAGWDIYPIGSGVKAGEAPKGSLAGIVIVQ